MLKVEFLAEVHATCSPSLVNLPCTICAYYTLSASLGVYACMVEQMNWRGKVTPTLYIRSTDTSCGIFGLRHSIFHF